MRSYFKGMNTAEGPTAEQMRKAFDVVAKEFKAKVKAAQASGEVFEGYDFERIHHWNWKLDMYPDQVGPVICFVSVEQGTLFA